MVFRPIPGELLPGRVHDKHTSAKNGLSVSLNFFRDTFIPSRLMANGMRWESNSSGDSANSDRDGNWVWDYTSEEGVSTLELLPSSRAMGDNSDLVLFRVTSVLFNDKLPSSSVGTDVEKRSAYAASSTGNEATGLQSLKGGPSHDRILDGKTVWAGGEEGDGIHTFKSRVDLLIPNHVAAFPPGPLQMTPSLQSCMTRTHATLGIGTVSNPTKASSGSRKLKLGHHRVEIDPQSQEAHMLDKRSRQALSVLVSNVTLTSESEDVKSNNIDTTHKLSALGLDRSLLENRPMLVVGTIQEDGLGGWTWWGDSLPEIGRKKERITDDLPTLQPAPRPRPASEVQDNDQTSKNDVLLVVDAAGQRDYNHSSGQKRHRETKATRGRRGKNA